MKPSLKDLIDVSQFQMLQDRLNEIYSFPSAIIDNDGNVLTASAWQDVCTKFHRKNAECLKECIKSDQYIQDNLSAANPAVSYRCPHGLVDNAAPIIIDGVHYGNFFTGQFFLEEPDLGFFRDQAKKFGFDEDAYIEAVRKVPLWTQEQLHSYLFFIKGLIEVISAMGLKNLKEAEARQQRQVSEEKNKTIIQAALDGFWLTDLDGRMLETNESYCRMSGYTTGELLTMRIWDLEANESPEMVAAHMQRIIEQRADRFETRHRRKDGSLFDVAVNVQYLAFEGGRLVVFIQDITERKRTDEKIRNFESRLRQSEKMDAIGQLAGGIAHDFNNVLGGIIGFTDMSLGYAEKGSLLESNLFNILKAADRAKNLVTQILAFSRQSNPQKSITSLRPIIKEVLDLIKSSIPSSVIIESDLHDNTKPVLADPTQIHEVLLNLATNAVHAMSRKGKLTVRMFTTVLDHMGHGQSGDIAPGEYTIIEVGDTGCGMDAAILSKAFEPFFTTKAVGEGTGMGLSVVLGIVQLHGGDIQVESTPGKGTMMRIFLPITEEPIPRSIDSNRRCANPGTERILFVDDEVMLAQMNFESLTSLGYSVTALSDSREALACLREKNADIDILVTDQTMPGITGIELATEALKIRNDFPIILCTGFSSEVNRESAMARGISKFIMKPYRPHEISKAIREVLDAKKMKA